MVAEISKGQRHHVRSWYGLAGEIDVENRLLHLVKVGSVPLHHPPLVNLLIRRGLPLDDRLRLSYLHEFGHFQTLPLAAVHLFWMARRGLSKKRSIWKWLLWLGLLGVAHEAMWEILSEGYVVFHERSAYWSTYKKFNNPFLPLFWGAIGALGIGLSLWVMSEIQRYPPDKEHEHERK